MTKISQGGKMRKTLFLAILALLAIGTVFGQVNIQAGQTVTQNFDEIGTSATATLPTAWKADKQTTARVVGTYSAAVSATERLGGNDMSTTASNGIYNYGAGIAADATDRGVGFLSSSSATKSGNLYVQLTNTGAGAITQFTVSYNVEKYRMGSNTAGFSMQMYYSTDGSTWTSAGASFTTSFTADGTNEGYASAPGATVNVNATLPQSLAAGSSIYLAWNYAVTSGSTTSNAQALGVDDISIIAAGGTPTPTISVNTNTLTGFTYIFGAGPSATQTFSISGGNLTANISIAAPTNYEISLAQTTGYTTPIVLTQSGGTVAATTIYVRLKAGLAAANYNGEVITASSTGAGNQTVTCSGAVTSITPTIVVTPTTLTGFTYVVGAGPSDIQTFSISGTNLTANISIATSTNYEISTTQTTDYTTPITLTNSGGTVATTTIYVRLKAGLTADTYNGELITASSTGATNQSVTCSGSVTPPAGPATFMEENFDYTAGTTLVSNGWVAHSGADNNSPTVADENLTYPGYYAYTGLSGQTLGNGEDVNKSFLPQTSGNMYVSFLFKATDVKTTGDYVFHLGQSPFTTTYNARLWAQKDGSDNVRFGVSQSSTIGNVVWSGYTYAMNTTYLFTIKYAMIPDAADQVYMWINPTIGATEPAPLLTATDTANDLANVGAVAIRQGSNTPVAKFDGIRVTNDWSLLWAGTPPATPVIHANTTPIEGLACIVGNPSSDIAEWGHYTLYGVDMLSQFTITAPTGFEVSSTTNIADFAGTIYVPSSFNGTIYVRMNAPFSGEYAGNIINASTGAVSVNVPVSGEAFNPPVTWNITQNLVAFSSQSGTPSAVQSYTLSATGASTNLNLSVGTPFQLSTTGTGNWLSSLSLLSTFNGSVYVRMNPVGAGTFNGVILHQNNEATDFEINISGTATPAAGMAYDLFFSEYIEGGSNNKAIEIFNGTGAAVDLSQYTIKLATNGSPWSNTLTPEGTLANGDVYVIANAGSIQAILDVADVTSTVTYYNGDDALGLFHGEIQIDAIGTYPSTTGVYWDVAGVTGATLNHTIVRKPNVIQGNLNWATSAGTNTDDSEWVVYAQDYIADLGIHAFGNLAATPTFNPPAGPYASGINVTISSTTAGATIRYTTDGSDPTGTSTLYATPIALSTNTVIKARAFATGFDPSVIATGAFYFPQNVANIAALRAGNVESNVYRLTGQAALTFQQTSRNQKYIQDATGAILIDDNNGIITSTYALYDGITGITGTLLMYNGLLQFVPIADPGIATSHNNVVVPAVRTLASITSDDQAKLLKILNVTVDATNVNFGTSAENINVTDAFGTIVMRTFAGTDYSGTAIPTAPVDIVCLGGQYGTTMQISPRFLADFSPASGTLEAPILQITQAGGNVTLTWSAVTGATNYRVESSDNPYAGFALVTTTSNLTYSGAATTKKFYRVIAIN